MTMYPIAAAATVFIQACRRTVPLWLCVPAWAHALAYGDLADMSLEELAGIQITSVSKKQERLGDAPASVFVITQEDIRRSGVASLPEALRLAPNLQVARVDARNYAVTARGFNSVFENKLLVLIDGRSVYTPLFSGVFWDAQEVMLEDIERIEVISGAGSTLWGANAVNGVINVITRAAGKTQGTLVALGGSAQDRVAAARHGGVLGEDWGHYRAYVKSSSAEDTARESGGSAFDGWRRSQAGWRADREVADQRITLQGDVYTARLHQGGTRDIHLNGFNVLGRLHYHLAAGSDFQLQLYVDHTERNQPLAFDKLTTLDAEAQHTIALGGTHRLSWGAAYRRAIERLGNDPAFAFLPGHKNLNWGSVFVQDEISLHPGLKVTAGWKLEHNSYTGLESMPNLRLAWKPAEDHLWWASAARSIRAPSRIDRDLYATSPPFQGGPDFQSEVAKTLEVGYRGMPLADVSFSITAFQSDYDRLRTLELNASRTAFMFGNQAEGRSRGVEMWSSWQVLPAWRVSGGLVSQQVEMDHKPAATLPAVPFDDTDPRHYWSLRVSGEFTARSELDVTLRRVGQLRRPEVPAYESLDLRLGWKLSPGLALSVVGQNLLASSHPEFSAASTRSQFERSVFFKALWQL